MPELKSCPFCSTPLRRVVSKARSFNPPRDYIEWHHDTPAVNCYIYNIKGPVVASTADNTKAEADFIAAWNTRAPSADPGFVCVPVWPTDVMLAASRRALKEYIDALPEASRYPGSPACNIKPALKAKIRWAAMIRASPKPPSAVLAASPSDAAPPPIPGMVTYNNPSDPVGMAKAKQLNDADRRVMESAQDKPSDDAHPSAIYPSAKDIAGDDYEVVSDEWTRNPDAAKKVRP